MFEETGPEQEWSSGTELFGYSGFFFGIVGQPREVHPKFRNQIPENLLRPVPKLLSSRPIRIVKGILHKNGLQHWLLSHLLPHITWL